MANVLLGINGRIEVGETLSAVIASDGAIPTHQWQALIGGSWTNVGVPGAPTYVIPSNAVGVSYRLVAISAGQTYYSEVTGLVTVDSNRAAAPKLAGTLSSATVQENAAPATLFSGLTFTDADKANYTGGSLLVTNTHNGGNSLDTLSIRFAGTNAGQFSYDAATGNVLYGFTAASRKIIGTIDTALNGAGTHLKVVFNENATKAVVDALIDNVTFANSDDSPSLSRLLTLRVTDPTGASAQRVLALNIAPEADAPVFTSAASFAIDENQTQVANVAATDPDQDPGAQQGMTYTLVDSAVDNARFLIDSGTGALRFASGADFEDTTHTPQYTVQVRATAMGGSSTEQTLTVTVRNLNEAPAAQDLAGTAQENGPAITLDALFTDPDANDTQTVTLDTTGTVGVVTLSGQTFSYDAAGRFESLAEGATTTDTFTYTVTDAAGLSDTRTASVTVVGSNDAASIDGMWSSVEEDVNAQNGQLTTGGTLTIVDPDAGENRVLAQTNVPPLSQAGRGWGAFSITPDGNWTYTVDNALVQSLRPTISNTEWLEVRSVDGTATAYVAVTIYGNNDAPAITGGTSTGTVAESGVLDDGTAAPGTPTAQGTLTASDVDEAETLTWSGSATGTYGAFTIDTSTGVWTYTLNNNAPATQALAEGQTATETFFASVRDALGATDQQQVTVTVNGANDFVGVSGSSNLTGLVDEPGLVVGKLSMPWTVNLISVDANNKTLFTGYVDDAPVLARVNTDGTLDATYGVAGVADISDVEYGDGMKLDSSGGAVLIDGNTVVRIDASGNRASEFGVNGLSEVAPSTEDYFVRLRRIDSIEADGGIVLIASESHDFNSPETWYALRISPNGTLDTAFGDQGRIQLAGSPEGIMRDIVVDAQGRFIVATACYVAGEYYTELWRYFPDGTRDTAYGGSGSVRTGYEPHDILVTDTGLVVAWTEYREPATFDLHLLRLQSNGQRDSTFGNAGEVVLSGLNTAMAQVDSQGRVLAAYNTQAYDDFHLVRFNQDGSIDTSFGSSGLATADFGGYDYVLDMAVRQDGGVLLTGWALNSADLANFASFDSSGQPDTRLVYEESGNVSAAGQLFVTGTDPDNGDLLQWSGSTVGAYGQFVVDAQGNWTYRLDPSNPATAALTAGQLAYDTFTATLADNYGATAAQEIVITIVGSYDLPAP